MAGPLLGGVWTGAGTRCGVHSLPLAPARAALRADRARVHLQVRGDAAPHRAHVLRLPRLRGRRSGAEQRQRTDDPRVGHSCGYRRGRKGVSSPHRRGCQRCWRDSVRSRGCPAGPLVLAAGGRSCSRARARANLAVQGLRLVDNGDNDGFADPNETIQVFVTLRNPERQRSARDRGRTWPAPIPRWHAFHSRRRFRLRCSPEKFVKPPFLALRVADVTRLDPFQDLSLSLEFVISGDDFATPQPIPKRSRSTWT